MLSLGISGYEKLMIMQQKNHQLLQQKMRETAEKLGERLLDIFNPVAIVMSLTELGKDQLYALGGALYNLRVTGPRVYDPNQSRFGTCCDNYPTPYIVMNAAIGATKDDILKAVERLEKAYNQINH